MNADLTPEDPENWDPIAIPELAALMGSAGRPWWIAGGLAIDLFLGRPTRPHRDVDVAVLRAHQLEFQQALDGWDLRVPAGWQGEPENSLVLFSSWLPGQWLGASTGQVWCRPGPQSPWSFELLFASGDGRRWRFKKEESIKLPIEAVGERSAEGVPFLRPEVVLLHKAVSTVQGENAEADFEVSVPVMDQGRRAWLLSGLRQVSPAHEWIKRLEQMGNSVPG